jgi:hypothetical protein
MNKSERERERATETVETGAVMALHLKSSSNLFLLLLHSYKKENPQGKLGSLKGVGHNLITTIKTAPL